MVSPARAPVRPRIIGNDGEVLLLEDQVELLLESGARGRVSLIGGPGAGKTTALRHLAWAHPQQDLLELGESAQASDLDRLALAPWGTDELIEYLQAVHPDCCSSVMKRIGEPDLDLRGCPELWTRVLDALAEDESLRGVRAGLQRHLDLVQPTDSEEPRKLGQVIACHNELDPARVSDDIGELLSVARHPVVVLLIAGEYIAEDLASGEASKWLATSLPEPLIQEVAGRIALLPAAQKTLNEILGDGQPIREYQSMAASMLTAALDDWRPNSGQPLDLSGAYLAGVSWDQVRLAPDSRLNHAQLEGANLRDAELHEVNACGANLTDAELSGADAKGIRLTHANLSGAQFRWANLFHAQLAHVTLEQTDFTGAWLDHAVLSGLDLRHCILDHTTFTKAQMIECNLEAVWLIEPRFDGANLMGALMTGSHFSRAKLKNACLVGAELAHIDWEGADLRGADLRRATFRLDTPGSGLIAAEGCWTGVYTDEFKDQGFRSPANIRHANLYCADLRGAKVSEADFYLVDLRGARYDPEQAIHFRRCGAIL